MHSQPPTSHLRDHRIRAGLSQEELARRANVSTSTIQKLEAGRTSPSLATARSLAAALGVPVDDLFEPVKAAS